MALDVDVATSVDDAATARWCQSRTENGNALIDVHVERHKLWPTQRDQEQYLEVCSAGSAAALERKHPARIGRKRMTRPVMVEAYLYFCGAIRVWMADRGDRPACVRALRQAMMRRLELVQIDLELSENPQEIFETLNARGVPLLASDLLRNYVFRRAGSAVECEALHARYWTRFEVPEDPEKPEGIRFWEREVRQGRLSRARLDLYLQHYLAMKLERDVRVGDLFREYKTWVEAARPFRHVEEELREFVRYAEHFASLVQGDASTPPGAFATRLAALDIQSSYPLVIGLLGEPNLSEAERDAIFVDLESFLVRRLVCGRSTANYTRKFLELLREFRARRELTRHGFRELMLRGEARDAFDWPTDAQFESAWRTTDAYRVLKPARVEMILRAIEEAMRSPLSEPVLFKKPLTVEHVMPQKWETHWPLPAGIDEDAAREQREEVVHDFGNLTLLTGELNSTIGNGPPAAKLAAILDHSNLQLSKWFVGKTTWSEDDIRARSRALLTHALKVWPRPT